MDNIKPRLYFSRVFLNQNAPTSAINPILDPDDPNVAINAHHRLIWTLFQGKDNKRDFLWRADKRGCFYILSRRPPNKSVLFHPISTTEFKPNLNPGDNLVYKIRLNATKDKSVPKEQRGLRRRQRVDLVMDQLFNKYKKNNEEITRSEKRMNVANEVAKKWMENKGKTAGFLSGSLVCDDYSVRQFKHSNKNLITFGILELTGIITIVNPTNFIDTYSNGFGRAKTFGCGLMLIKRV